MLLEQWDFVQEMEDHLPSRSKTEARSEYVDAIHEYILHTYPGEVTSSDRNSSRCCAHVFAEILDGKRVVEPPDIDAAIEFGKSNIPDDKPVTRVDVESWFGLADLEKVERKYFKGSSLGRFNNIYVAPVVPTVDDLVEAVGNPPILTDSMIENALLQTSFKPENQSEVADSEPPKVDSDKLTAYVGLTKSRMDDGPWYRIENSTTTPEIWTNPDILDEVLKAEGPKISRQRVITLTDELITEKVPEDLENKIDIPSIRPYILDVLYEKREWKILSRKDEVFWYCSDDKYVKELGMWADYFQDIATSGESSSRKALEAAKQFFELNGKDLVREFNTDPEKLGRLIDIIKGDIRAKQLLDVPDSAKVGPSDEDIESEVEFEPPPFREIAKEYERKLEERQDEEFEPDDSIADFKF